MSRSVSTVEPSSVGRAPRAEPEVSGRTPGTAPPAPEATRRRLTARRAATVERLAGAVVDELAQVGYDELTVRTVARRAGVAPATAYTYFASKAHLVAEAFWRRLHALPEPERVVGATAAERVGATLRSLADLVAGEPHLSAACSPALLGADPDVVVLRDRIGGEIHRRLRDALVGEPRASADPATAAAVTGPAAPDRAAPGDVEDLVTALDLMTAGALLRAGMGHMAYDDLGDQLAALAVLVIGDRP